MVEHSGVVNEGEGDHGLVGVVKEGGVVISGDGAVAVAMLVPWWLVG